ncbi:MAG: cysteine desulfurase NifS [Candidatus Woesearchaeota archaeon]
MRVYLDNGATTKTDHEVVKAMMPYFTEVYGNASSLHSIGEEASKALQNVRKTIAQKINAMPEEIIFTSGGTESDNLAIKGVAYANKEKGRHIITTKIEHHAVLYTCKQLEREGFEVTYLNVDAEGFVDLKELEKNIKEGTILVSIMYANNEIGTIEPIEEIGKICKKHKIIFHTDAVQSFCKVPIDVKKMNIDLLSASSHKIHGPKGIGMLYVRKGTQIQRMADGGEQEFRLRAGTENIAGAVGFAKAVELANEADCQRMAKLRDKLINGLLAIENTKLNGPRERLCNNANISFNFIEGEGLLYMLNDMGIEVSTGSACSSKSLAPSHVLLAIGLRHEVAHGSIRFTLSKYTTEQEIDYTIEKVKEAVTKLRRISPLQVS